MDVFHVVMPLKQAEIVKAAISTKMLDRNDIFCWSCVAVSNAEPTCVACSSIPENLMKYVYMMDPERLDRFFFWRVDGETGILLETNAAASIKNIGQEVDFKDCISSIGYRLRKFNG